MAGYWTAALLATFALWGCFARLCYDYLCCQGCLLLVLRRQLATYVAVVVVAIVVCYCYGYYGFSLLWLQLRLLATASFAIL